MRALMQRVEPSGYGAKRNKPYRWCSNQLAVLADSILNRGIHGSNSLLGLGITRARGVDVLAALMQHQFRYSPL